MTSIPRPFDTRRDGACLAAIVVAALAVIAPAIWSNAVIGQYPSDGTRALYFVRELLLQALAEHRLPLWNPYTQFGAPFLANVQWGVFYPLNFPLAYLPVDLAYNLFIAVHLAIAGACMFLLARDWQLDRVPAIVAAFAFMLNGRFMSWAWGGGLNHLSTMAWLPLLVLLFTRAVTTSGNASLLWTAASAVALALQILCGHPQYTMFSVVVVLFVAFWQQLEVRGVARRLRPFVLWAAVVATAAGLAAVQLGLTYEATALSTRSFAWRVAWPPASIEGSYNPLRLASWIAPDLFGNSVSLRPASTDWLSLALKESHSDEFRGYVGLLPLLLALPTLRHVRTSRQVAMLWSLTALSLLLALGRFTPLYGVAYAAVPPFRAFRIPARLLTLVVFSVALLGGIGAQDLLEATDARFLGWSRALGCAAAVMLAGVALAVAFRNPLVTFGANLAAPLFAARPSGFALAADARNGLIASAFALSVRSALISAVIVAAASAIFKLSGRRGSAVAVGTAIVVVTVAELGLQASMYTVAEPMSTHYVQNASLVTLLRAAPDARAYTLNAATAAARPDPIRPSDNVFMHERLSTAGGYDSFELDSYRTAINLVDDELRHGSTFLASVFGLRYIVSQLPIGAASLHEVGSTGGATIFENREALDRFYVAGAARRVSYDGAVAGLRTHALRPGDEVFIESANDIPAGVPGVAGTVSVISFAPEDIQLRVHADRAAVLVANETYYPGWTARVDGAPAPVLRANGHMRAVMVGAGEHTVSMRFSPTRLKSGGWISAACAAGLLLFVGLVLSRANAA